MLVGWSPRAVRQALLAYHSYAHLPRALSRSVQYHTPWRFTLRDSQKYAGVGQASSRLAVVSRAGAGSGCSRFTPASYDSAATVHRSRSIAASTPHPWRRRGCLHEENNIGQGSAEVQRIYAMGSMHTRHTQGAQSADTEPSGVLQPMRTCTGAWRRAIICHLSL